MNKLQFKNEWRLARSGVETLTFIQEMLTIRDTNNNKTNFLFKNLINGAISLHDIDLNIETRSIIVYGRLTPIFAIINRGNKNA